MCGVNGHDIRDMHYGVLYLEQPIHFGFCASLRKTLFFWFRVGKSLTTYLVFITVTLFTEKESVAGALLKPPYSYSDLSRGAILPPSFDGRWSGSS